MTSFMIFQVDIAKPMEAILKRQLEITNQRSGNTTTPFDVDVPFLAPGPPPGLPPNERFAVDSFQGFTEVSDTLQRLFDIAVYVRRFPFRRTQIPRARYLRFHIEAYFHEIYILRERLLTLAKRATRAYRKSMHRDLATEVAGRLDRIVSALEDLISVRARHVHELRFDETRLRNLDAIELIERNSDDPIWSMFIHEQDPKVRRYWVAWVTEMNAAVEELLNRYFAELHRLMFEKRRFRFPYAAT